MHPLPRLSSVHRDPLPPYFWAVYLEGGGHVRVSDRIDGREATPTRRRKRARWGR